MTATLNAPAATHTPLSESLSTPTPFTQTRAAASHRHRPGEGRARTVLTADGTRLACTEYGDPDAAHTLVFLHGLCLNSTTWTRHIDELTATHGPDDVRIISYDHRGHGASASASARSYTVQRLASDLTDVLTALHVHGPLTLIGHSMGAMAALAYLAQPSRQRPCEPTGLVLIATAAGKLTERGLGRLLAAPGAAILLHHGTHAPAKLLRIAAKPTCTLLSRFGNRLAATTLASVTVTALTTTPPRTALGFLRALRTYNLYSALPTISARTVILSGDIDPLTPPEHGRDLAAAIPGARHIVVTGAGHMLAQQAPTVISHAIADTLAAT